MTEAFGYLRVSGRDQLDGDGFPRQREAILRYAAANDLRIVRWFEERAVCGATEWENRPAWTDMIAALNGCRTIAIERLDRLARDLMVQEHIIQDVRRRGIALVSTAEPDLMSQDPTRVLMRQILGAISSYDRACIVQKLRGARVRQKARDGRCEGRKPFGSRPGESEALEQMRTLYGAGIAYDGIAERLNQAGVPTRVVGARWHAATVRRILARESIIEQLKGFFVFSDDSVSDFLAGHPSLPAMLLEAMPELKRLFGSDTVFKLNRSMDGQTLYAVAMWPGAAGDARQALSDFDEWWRLADRRDGSLIFTYELV